MEPTQTVSTETDNPNRLQEELQAENAELRRRLAAHEQAEAQREADEAVIGEKIRCGLTREQAIAVIRRQREFDALPRAGSKTGITERHV